MNALVITSKRRSSGRLIEGFGHRREERLQIGGLKTMVDGCVAHMQVSLMSYLDP